MLSIQCLPCRPPSPFSVTVATVDLSSAILMEKTGLAWTTERERDHWAGIDAAPFQVFFENSAGLFCSNAAHSYIDTHVGQEKYSIVIGPLDG